MYGGNRPLTDKAKKYNKILNIILTAMLCTFYAMFVMLAIAMILEIQFIFGSILCLTLPLAIFFIIWRYIHGMDKSYLELNDGVVTVVDYYIFSIKKRKIDVNDIGFAKIMNGISRKLPGRAIKAYSFNYAVFYDKQCNYLFKCLMECEEEQTWLVHLQNSRKEVLEIRR